MAALGRQADNQPGRMTALTNTGRSECLELPNLNGSQRPGVASPSREVCIRGLERKTR